ncbi:MAG: hypothetical protein SNJ64_06045 [Endomicrobiia bacterium]
MSKFQEIKFFNKHFYKLVQTTGWSTIQIDGIQMHRTVRFTPETDAQKKVESLHPFFNDLVLDICTGLGYTSIFLIKNNCRVCSIEKDENVITIAKQNEFSRDFFVNLTENFPPEQKKIKLFLGNAVEIVKTFDSEIFDAILHDPPRFNIAEELYTKSFYEQLYRILKPNHKLLHYVGNPHSKHPKYKNVIPNIIKKLSEAGFKNIVPIPDIECFLATK